MAGSAKPRSRPGAPRSRSTCARGHVDRQEARWAWRARPRSPSDPPVPCGVGYGSGALLRPRSRRLHSIPIWKAVTSCGTGRDGGGGSDSRPGVLLTPRPARWQRAGRDLGRALPGGVGSREEGVSSHPPGGLRGGAQAGRGQRRGPGGPEASGGVAGRGFSALYRYRISGPGVRAEALAPGARKGERRGHERRRCLDKCGMCERGSGSW